ncbi:MAG: hypothetical protein EZS28_025535, partial [Streblomastix strix]
KAEEYEQDKETTKKEIAKTNEEIKRRKEAEKQLQNIKAENKHFKLENEMIKLEIIRIKQKFGSEKIDEEIQIIEKHELEKEQEIEKLKKNILNIVKENDEQIQNLREEIENEKKKTTIIKETHEILKLDPIIDINNLIPQDIEFSDIDGVMKKLTKKDLQYNVISLTQVMEHDIWSLEAEFNNSQDFVGIGIVRDSCEIQPGVAPWDPQLINYSTKSGWDFCGSIYYNDVDTVGNTGYKDGQIVRAELDFRKQSLLFFVDEIQQPIIITNINDKIFLYQAGSECIIRSLKKLEAPTSEQVEYEKAIQWLA